jgi:DinB superfamily
MNGKDAIKAALDGTSFILKWYVSDLSDADLFIRPAPKANHIAWQLGHVITGDIYLIKSQLPDAAYPELPAGFTEAYGAAGASKDGPEGFLTKDEYLALFDMVRAATITELGALSDADLDRPTTGDMAAFAPTLGHLFLGASNHTLMHAGQFTVVRRLLGKPVLM